MPPRRRMHSPSACASCTMRNVTEDYGTLRTRYERYRTLRERYRAVAEHSGALQKRHGNVMEHYGSVTGRYGAPQNVTEALRKRYGAVAER